MEIANRTITMPENSDPSLNERVKKLEERVDQLFELLQIVPRMDTKQSDYSSGPEHAKIVFLGKLAEIMEDPSIAAEHPFGR
jgi:hypothetical protein